MNNHGNPQPFSGPVPDLAAIARQEMQRTPQFAVQMIAGPQFTITVPYNATPVQRTKAVETARKLLIEMATGVPPDAKPAQERQEGTTR